MDTETAAKCFAELGSPQRLEVIRALAAAEDGMTVGEIQSLLGVPKSSLSHHISHLLWAGLIRRRREGRHLRCTVDWDRMNAVLMFMTHECCQLAPTEFKPRQHDVRGATEREPADGA